MRNIRVLFLILIFCTWTHFAQAKVFEGEGDWSFGGFIDLRYQEGDLNSLENGFQFYDGAFQVLGKFANDYSVFIDISMGWQGGVDTDADGKVDDFSNSWGVAKERAQVYLVHEKEKYKLLLGQFDSPFGFESNDSRDLFFAKHGLMFNEFTSTTHVGVKGEWRIQPFFEIHAIISNPGGEGSYGEDRPEYALQTLLKHKDFYLLPGYYTRRVQNETLSLLNIYGGWTPQDFQIHLEFNQHDNPSLKEKALGYMLLTTFKPNEWWTLGARLEAAENLEALIAPSNKSAQQISLSLFYHVNPKLRLMAEHTQKTYAQVVGKDVKGNESTLSFQQSF